jgi:hypothetical protein
MFLLFPLIGYLVRVWRRHRRTPAAESGGGSVISS